MKKIFYLIPAVLLLTCCNGAQKEREKAIADSLHQVAIEDSLRQVAIKDSIARADSIAAAEKAIIEQQTNMLTTFFKKGVRSNWAEQHMTTKLKKKLQREYEEEYGETGGSANWMLDGSFQMDTPNYSHTSPVNIGPNRYKITHIYNLGSQVEKCTITYTLEKEGGEWKIDSYKM